MKESKYNIWLQKHDSHYVYNGVSGALLSVSEENRSELLSYLAGDQNHSVTNAQLADYLNGSMVIADDFDEVAALEAHYVGSRHQTEHLGLTILSSLGCNFDCPYCFELKKPSVMHEDVQDSVVAMVKDKLDSIRSLSVEWFGGEPLVGRKAVYRLSRQLMDLCASADVKYSASMVTNGYLLDQETCEQLSLCAVKDMQISLDGPPHIHDVMRPLRDGGSTFARIVENLHHAVGKFNIIIRINVDKTNILHAEELLQILHREGFSGKLAVYIGQLTGVNDGVPSPSTSYGSRCMSRQMFSAEELKFTGLAAKYGFAKASLPRPKGAPCTAVRVSDLIIGSEGELYKCYESAGTPGEVIGNMKDYRTLNSNVRKWLDYSPFRNSECLNCIALPVCMGGCPHHAFDLQLYNDRCGTFRHNHRERIGNYIDQHVVSAQQSVTEDIDASSSHSTPPRPPAISPQTGPAANPQ